MPQVAEQQGKWLAKVLNQEAKEKPGWHPSDGFVFRSLGSMASVGGHSAIVSLEVGDDVIRELVDGRGPLPFIILEPNPTPEGRI